MNNCVIQFLIPNDSGSESGVFQESLTALLPLIPTSAQLEYSSFMPHNSI